MVRLEGYEKRSPSQLSGRPAPAGRAGPRARQPAAGPAPRRAAWRPRPQAARADADRAEGDPEGGRHHLHLRHPRPGGGAHHERPPGRLQPRTRSSRSARPADVYEHPTTPFVAGFVGTSNLLKDETARASSVRTGLHRSTREDPDRRPRCREPGSDEQSALGQCAKSSTSAPTRDISLRSTSVASSSSPSRTCRRHPWRPLPPRAEPYG